MAKTSPGKKTTIVKKPNPLGIIIRLRWSNICKSFRSFLSFLQKPRDVNSYRDWAHMDADLLSKIFLRVNLEQLCFNVPMVCHWWRSTSREIFFWEDVNTINLKGLSGLVYLSCPVKPLRDGWDRARYMRMLYSGMVRLMDNCHVLGNKQRTITSIKFPRYLYFMGSKEGLGDNELAFFASRSRHVKKVKLENMYFLRDDYFSVAMRYWRYLEELSIGPVMTPTMMPHVVEALSIHSKNLHTLHISSCSTLNEEKRFSLCEHNAELIATQLRLKKFIVTGSRIHKDGVTIFLNRCNKQLSNVSFEKCEFIIPASNQDERVKTARMRKQIIYLSNMECIKWSIELMPRQLFTSYELVRHLFRREIVMTKQGLLL